MADQPPVNDKNNLYIYMPDWSSDHSMRGLIDEVKSHFPRAHFLDIDIGVIRVKERGCMCHPESSDYNTYLHAYCKDLQPDPNKVRYED